MKLLVLVNSTIWGGAEIFLWRLLRELATQGLPVVVVYPPRGGDLDRFRELPLVAWQNEALGLPVGRSRGMGSLAMMLAPRRGRIFSLLERMKREHHCDTVLSQDPREQILTAMVGPELGYRVVWLIHQRLYYPLHRVLIDPKLCRAMHRVDLAFVISESTRRALILKGFPERKMQPLRVGIEQPAGPVTWPTSRPRSIGVLTRLSYDKGVQDILEAMPSVLSEFPEAKLLIAGDGRYRRKLDALARKLGIAPSVIFLGWISDSWEFLSRISVLVHATFNPGNRCQPVFWRLRRLGLQWLRHDGTVFRKSCSTAKQDCWSPRTTFPRSLTLSNRCCETRLGPRAWERTARSLSVSDSR